MGIVLLGILIQPVSLDLTVFVLGARVALRPCMLEPVIPANAASERDVIGQIKLAFSTPLPLIIGALIGALVPLATYTVGHRELAAAGWTSVAGAIVVGGCLFSAITVYKWGERAFGNALKAIGFVVLSEGVMTFSTTPWLSMLVLGFMIAINAVANGANLAVAHLDAEALRCAARALVASAALVEAPSSAALVAPVAVVPSPVAIPELIIAAVKSTSASIPEQDVKSAPSRRRATNPKAIKMARGSRRASTTILN
jgi:hypothetical protein